VTVYTLFGQEATGSSLNSDTDYYTMGVQFSVDVSGATLTAIWFYSASGAGVLPQDIALFAVSGQSLVHTESASWSGAAGSGWVRAPFSSPPALTSGVSYKACVIENTGDFEWYSATGAYWSTGAGSGGITSGPVSAPNNAGGDGGQDTFNNGATLTYPDTSFNAANYWVDPEVTATVNVTGTFGYVPDGDEAREFKRWLLWDL